MSSTTSTNREWQLLRKGLAILPSTGYKDAAEFEDCYSQYIKSILGLKQENADLLAKVYETMV